MKNVLIVGCGKIAGLYEEKKSKSVFSHAKAIKNNNYFNLKSKSLLTLLSQYNIYYIFIFQIIIFFKI